MRGIRADNVIYKAMLDQCGQISTVIHVRVRKQNRINRRRVKGQVRVTFVGLGAVPLHQPAIQ